MYIRDNYERLAEINTEDDLDYTQEILKSVYEHGMEEGFISWKQKSYVDGLINRIALRDNEDDILDRVDPVDFSFDIEEEE